MECGVEVLLDIFFYISIAFLLVKNCGVIYLIGVGVGFSLTSWVIYKVYSTARRKRRSQKPSISTAESEVRWSLLCTCTYACTWTHIYKVYILHYMLCDFIITTMLLTIAISNRIIDWSGYASASDITEFSYSCVYMYMWSTYGSCLYK